MRAEHQEGAMPQALLIYGTTSAAVPDFSPTHLHPEERRRASRSCRRVPAVRALGITALGHPLLKRGPVVRQIGIDVARHRYLKCETIRRLVERPGARRAQVRNSQTILICRFDNSPGPGKGRLSRLQHCIRPQVALGWQPVGHGFRRKALSRPIACARYKLRPAGSQVHPAQWLSHS